ncbi:hotdog family protein [Dechloromonas sp.]|uniref:hotdog family protein n=1 Tax=Dechloromonas sp. TaxID=1917218 RepID=UPI0011FCC3B8|nr:hotdog family protein [Dechloromonas sp.]MBU3695281.1 3-hydroxylacyl-ACP dehydratase [Dechloromonas sp.]TEX49923.1 MAG: 3-hydroxylacyl-ACP dehydratase [Rhodocyclaceae bacterium]
MSTTAGMPLLDRAAIAACIPHQGNMCLLDAVTAWDDSQIVCLAISHTDPANPLRAEGRLGAANGIEYAAQAMAIHGALLAGSDGPPRQGYLASVRGVTLHVDRLDALPEALTVRAERLSGDANNILYQFSLSHGADCLLEGRAAVILDAAAPQVDFHRAAVNPENSP